jgi:hypothetical protein
LVNIGYGRHNINIIQADSDIFASVREDGSLEVLVGTDYQTGNYEQNLSFILSPEEVQHFYLWLKGELGENN